MATHTETNVFILISFGSIFFHSNATAINLLFVLMTITVV